MKTLSERLASAMQQTGLSSQTELSKRSGVDQSIISKILRGDSKTSKSSGKLAAALGISADWLINGQGNIFGSLEKPHEKVDVSKQVSVWDINGNTGQKIDWICQLTTHHQAYIITNKTGVSQVPGESIVIVDPFMTPCINDLVIAIVSGTVSVFRYHLNGAGESFLSVDDDRVPLAKVDTSSIRGPIVQIFIKTLSI